MSNDPIVKPRHIRPLCARGARAWFKRHGLSYSDFVSKGTPASVIEATGDALGLQVAARARQQAVGGEA